MAALADYLDLRFAVGDHVGKRMISDVMPRLVQLAESRLNRVLRTRYQVNEVDLTFVDGMAALPADFLEILFVPGLHGGSLRAGTQLEYFNAGSGWSDFTINGSYIAINGYAGDRSILYYAKLPTLTTSPSASNWLLANYPDAYLYATGAEAAKHLKDVELATASEALLGPILQAIKIDDERARWSASSVRLQGITP